MNTPKIILSTFFTFLLTVNARAQFINFSSLKNNLHSYLEIIHAKKGFSGEILVGQGEQIVFQEAIGLSSVEHNLTMEIGANYQIASITKTFTGTLIAFAQREHKLLQLTPSKRKMSTRRLADSPSYSFIHFYKSLFKPIAGNRVR